jgi:hypothetical protein
MQVDGLKEYAFRARSRDDIRLIKIQGVTGNVKKNLGLSPLGAFADDDIAI